MNNTETIIENKDENVVWILEPLENLVSGTFLDNSIFYILVIVAATFLLAYITKFIFKEVFTKIFEKTQTDLDDKIITILEKPIFTTVL